MLISKHHLKTRFTASKDKSRPILTTIQMTSEGDEVVAVATDGYILSEVREHTPSDDEFPNIESQAGVTEARTLATTAGAISASIKKDKSLPILNYAHVGTGGITVTNLEQTQEFKDNPVEGKFPDYKELIPAADEAKAVVTINPGYLATLAKVFKDEPSVTLEIHGPQAPVVIRSSQFERTITGIIMPLKS